MTDQTKQNLYADAWHKDRPYSADEAVRLERACRMIARHAESFCADRKYRLVDIGCGVGPLRQWLPAGRFEISGLDLSEEAAVQARLHYDDCKVADVEHTWPFVADTYDGVHAGAVLEHVLDWHTPLNQANRILRDGGLLVISVPNLRHWKEIKRLIRGKQPHWLCDMQHVHAYTPKFLSSMVSLHGFEVCDLQTDHLDVPFIPRRSVWASRAFATIGSVLILAARLKRRVRIEDGHYASQYPRHREVGLRSIEVPLG